MKGSPAPLDQGRRARTAAKPAKQTRKHADKVNQQTSQQNEPASTSTCAVDSRRVNARRGAAGDIHARLHTLSWNRLVLLLTHIVLELYSIAFDSIQAAHNRTPRRHLLRPVHHVHVRLSQVPLQLLPAPPPAALNSASFSGKCHRVEVTAAHSCMRGRYIIILYIDFYFYNLRGDLVQWAVRPPPNGGVQLHHSALNGRSGRRGR